MKPTLLWKLYIIFIYLIFYLYEYNLIILLYLIIFTIILILLIFFLKNRKVNLNFLLPPHKINLVWVIILLWILYLVSLYQIKTQENQNSIKIQYFNENDYIKIKNYQYGFTFYADFLIKKVLYPGMYVGELKIRDIKKYYKNKSNLKISTEDYKDKVILVALNSTKKDLWQNCKLDIFFYGKVFFYPIETKNSYFEFLYKNDARYYLKILEKNINTIECNQNINTEIKEEVIDIIKKYINNTETQGILIGLILGNSNWMEKETKDKIKKLGLLHLFAASGLHLGIIFYVLFYPLSKIFGKKHYISYFIPLPFLFFYLYILNFPYTLIRAFIFISIIGLLMMIHKKNNSLDLLLNTFIIMMLIFPLSIINLSTFMSFMAVSGILFFYGNLQNLFIKENRFPDYNISENIKYNIKKFILLQFIITFSASFFFQPFIFYIFRGYSILSPVYNMLFVPIVSIFLPVLYFSTIFTIVFKDILFFDIIIQILWFFLNYTIEIILYFMDYFYKYVLWLHFESSLNYGFISSLIFSILILYLFLINKKEMKDKMIVRNLFFIAYIFYQSSLLIYYLWNIHFLVKLPS